MIIDIGSAEAFCALFDWNVEKSWLNAWLALLLELLAPEAAAVEALPAVELESLDEEAWW